MYISSRSETAGEIGMEVMERDELAYRRGMAGQVCCSLGDLQIGKGMGKRSAGKAAEMGVESCGEEGRERKPATMLYVPERLEKVAENYERKDGFSCCREEKAVPVLGKG